MKSTSLFALLFLLPVSGCLLADEPRETEMVCAQSTQPASCFLEAGRLALQQADDNFSWGSGALELAIAYDAQGAHEIALSLTRQAISRAYRIESTKQREALLVEAMTSLSELSPSDAALAIAEKLLLDASSLEAPTQSNLRAKSTVVHAVHGDKGEALQRAISLPESTALEENHKAIALRKVAALLAKSGRYEESDQAIKALTMSIPYYGAMVRSDVARIALADGESDYATELLSAAELIARTQDNGYFIGAALRDVGYAWQSTGRESKASMFFDDAVDAAALAQKQNEKARAVSRIATRLADAGLYDDASPVLDKAMALADPIEDDTTKGYTYYEISGSAAFAGQFELANALLERVPDTTLGSSTSMRSAAMRDIAWGQTRHGNIERAQMTCEIIPHPREKIQCLSRVVRVLTAPNSPALARYL